MNDDYVKIMKCRFCGGRTNSIALHTRLKSIKGDVFDKEPCERCRKLFGTHRYFFGDCGHNGFVRRDALKGLFTEDVVKRIDQQKIFRMEKCFSCLGMIKLKECPPLLPSK